MSQDGKSPQDAVSRGAVALGMLVGRSLLPLAAVVIIAGTLVWGPWVTLMLGMTWWAVGSFLG